MKPISFLVGMACFGVAFAPLTPVIAEKVRGEITPSEFDRKLEPAREAAFTPWMPVKEAFATMRKVELEQKIPLAAERNIAGQYRYIIFFPLDGKGADITYEGDVAEADLLERHALWDKQAFNILYVQKNPPPAATYTAIWIESSRYGTAVKRMNELGISPASIRIKPDATAKANPPPAVTAPMREWHDKSGRVIKASVEGVDGTGVKFVLTDGRRATVPLDNLSDADRKFLAELEKSPAAPPLAEKSAGMTDWMSRTKFDTMNTEERAKGMYPLYVESNVRNEMRGIFERRLDGLGLYLGWQQSEQNLREQDASYKDRGYLLLSLSYDRRSEKYCAVWIGERMINAAKGQLANHGITPASIGEKITVSTISKH